jgi:hypothetical protein
MIAGVGSRRQGSSGIPGRGALASPNEDVVVLPRPGSTTAGSWSAPPPGPGNGRDRLVGTDENGAMAPGSSMLELAAEAVEVDAVARLGTGLAGAGWATAEEGRMVAATPPAATFPVARRKLAALGFGLVQQGGQA